MTTTSPQDDIIIVLDTETTGLDHKTEKLLEIAAVKMRNGEVEETFSSLVNPQKPIRHSSFLIHHISEEMIADAPTIEEVLPKFLEFVEDYTFVAHNAIFDYSFINEACKAVYGERFKNNRIDTFEMYRAVFPEENSHGLHSLLGRFGYDETVVHRALDDAMCLAKVYPQLRALYEQKYSWQLSQLENVPYLVERYNRMQKACQMLQAEMADLKEIFKLYFQNGGKSVPTTTGELMVNSYRRTYSYDDKRIWEIAMKADVGERIYKLNPRALDKLVDYSEIDESIKEEFRECRLSMHESRGINFIKAQTPETAAEIAEEVIEEVKIES